MEKLTNLGVVKVILEREMLEEGSEKVDGRGVAEQSPESSRLDLLQMKRFLPQVHLLL